MHSTTRTAAAVAASALVIGLTGCAVGTGGGRANESDFGPSASPGGTLNVMGFSGVDEIATTRMDLAKAELPGVEVKLSEGDLDLQQFLSGVASGNPPDLIYADRDQIGSLAARGAILPLTACIEGEGIDTDAFVTSALSQVTLDGTVYGIPEFNSVQLIMANANLLSAAGLSTADVNGSDWNLMSDANRTLARSERGRLSVIGVDSKLPEFLPLWAKANGASVLSDDGRTAQLDDEKVVQALTWAVSIYDDQGGFSAVKAFRDSADFFGAGNQFASGTLGVMPMEQWYLNVLNDVSPTAPLAFDTVRDRTGQPLAYASGSAWAIPSGAANPAAACRWAKTMTEQSTWEAAAQARLDKRSAEGKPFTGILTANKDADAAIKGMVTPGGEPWATGVQKMYEANDRTFSLPANPADAEFTTAMQDAVNAVLNGQATPQDALARAQTTAQKALDDAWASLEQKG